MGSHGIGKPSENPSNKPTTHFDVVPPEAQSLTLPGQTYVNVCIWIPHLLMVLPTIQSPRHPSWTLRRVRKPKYFILPGIDWCVTTVNSSLTHRRIPKSLLPFFCPTKPTINALTNPCMSSMQDSPHVSHQIKFDMDSQKFLIDSGASAHLGNRCKDFIYYRSLSPQEKKSDQVLGVSGEAVAPQGIGSIQLRIEDDLNDIHTIRIHDVRYLPESPINIFVLCTTSVLPTMPSCRRLQGKLFHLSQLHLPAVDRRKRQTSQQIRSLEQEQCWYLLYGFRLQAIQSLRRSSWHARHIHFQ